MWDRPVRWDPKKARRNLAKHGVSFGEAEAVLHDPLAIVEPDVSHSQHELRFRITGADRRGRIVVAVFAVDESATIRILSARRPTRRERHAYHESG